MILSVIIDDIKGFYSIINESDIFLRGAIYAGKTRVFHTRPHIELYNLLIPSDHLLHPLNKLVNTYCLDNGRPAKSPITMFKYLLLKCIHDLSDRDLMDRANMIYLLNTF